MGFDRFLFEECLVLLVHLDSLCGAHAAAVQVSHEQSPGPTPTKQVRDATQGQCKGY